MISNESSFLKKSALKVEFQTRFFVFGVDPAWRFNLELFCMLVCFCEAFWCRVKVHKFWDFTPPRVDFAYLPASHPQTVNFKGESEQVTFS